MNYEYVGYNRLFADEVLEIPDCKVYNKWVKKISKSRVFAC